MAEAFCLLTLHFSAKIKRVGRCGGIVVYSGFWANQKRVRCREECYCTRIGATGVRQRLSMPGLHVRGEDTACANTLSTGRRSP